MNALDNLSIKARKDYENALSKHLELLGLDVDVIDKTTGTGGRLIIKYSDNTVFPKLNFCVFKSKKSNELLFVREVEIDMLEKEFEGRFG